jgi:hypothetical protein
MDCGGIRQKSRCFAAGGGASQAAFFANGYSARLNGLL